MRRYTRTGLKREKYYKISKKQVKFTLNALTGLFEQDIMSKRAKATLLLVRKNKTIATARPHRKLWRKKSGGEMECQHSTS